MLSHKTRRNISRIIPYGVIWVLTSVVYLFLERGLLAELHEYPATGNPYNFSSNIISLPLGALVTGLMIGVLEIYYFSRWFRNKSFPGKIMYKSLIYLLAIFVYLIVTFIVGAPDSIHSVGDKEVWADMYAFFTSYSFFGVILFMASGIVVSQFYTETSESIGPEKLKNFFLGKYHRPVQEDRIFMFLDMRSSTTIAESLGHVKYFAMLKNYFADLSEPVIDYAGELYQYAGDEMIVSWNMHRGLTDDACIRCFQAMQQTLKARSEKYSRDFGVVPEFKAGLHCGRVTTGEVGVLKKEIIFTGDVLNTTARIQGLCNQYGCDILISNDLADKLRNNGSIKFISLGTTRLKGREEEIMLYTI